MPKLISVMPVRQIEKLPPGKHAVAPSLYIAVSHIGGRSWVYRFTVAGRKVDMGIGSCRTMTRDDALREVEKLQAQRRAGVDPLTARRQNAAADAVHCPTFRQAAIDFHKSKAKAWSKSHAKAWLLEMEREVFPAIGDNRVDAIEVADVLRALLGWTERHETASRCRGRVEQILDACKTLGFRKGENPAIWKGNLQNLLPSPKDIKKTAGERHHGAMDWKELPGFVGQLGDTDAARALKFLILTATRSNETRDAAWSEIDLERGVWTIPAERMKARQEHIMPLTAPALAILEGIEHKGDLVFDIGRDAMRELLPEGSTVHGMRAAFSTWAGKSGLPRDTVEQCLAHTVGSAVERAYRRGSEVEQKRRIMDRWASYLQGCENQSVVMLDSRRA